MRIPIRSERHRRRLLQVLIEVEAEHMAQCECPTRCEMLRKLREEIAELRDNPKKGRFKCRDFICPTHGLRKHHR
jgi:hypothetical protein